MNNSLKNKNVLVIVFEVLIIVLGIGGITYATQRLLNSSTSTIIKAGKYNLDYVGEEAITFNGLEPISDRLINYNTYDNVIRVDFSLRGVKENNGDDLIYDVMLSDMNIDCSLLNKYTKWNLYKNGSLLSSGSLDPTFDGNVLTDNMRLTTIQQDLPKYNENYDNYVLIFWISESCDDLETCELIDQSNILDSKFSMKVFIALYGGEKAEYERIPNYDTSCANKPILYNNMIAVNYKNGEWVVADASNSNKDNLWYDYSNQVWANSVIVKDISKYQEEGTVISNDDVYGYYVWIPRYRYKLWNALDSITDTYNAYDEGIDIIFENGLGNSSNKDIINDKYITHPVFNDNLKGFWISKYEISKDNDEYRFIPNTDSYRGDTLENYTIISSNISNNYNLGNSVESHIVSNLEWGSTLYLSHSKYGVCNDGCNHISINNTYISGSDKGDTTTRNVYGVYDMAGGSGEYVLGASSIGTATSEVLLENGDTWYNGHGLVSNRDYIIRGGIGVGMFYFGDITMSDIENATRLVLVSK